MKKKNNSEDKKENQKKDAEEKESELEKEIEKSEEEIEEESEFEEETRKFPSERIKAPVLEQINMSEVPINLERNISSERISAEKNENKNEEFNYAAKGNGEEPKYQNYENKIFTDLRHSEIENLGRGDLFPRKNVGFADSPEAKPVEPKYQRYESASRIDVEKLGREKFPERKEIKYKSSRS